MNMPDSLYRNGDTAVVTHFRVTQYLVTKDGARSEIGAKTFYITYQDGQPVAVAEQVQGGEQA